MSDVVRAPEPAETVVATSAGRAFAKYQRLRVAGHPETALARAEA